MFKTIITKVLALYFLFNSIAVSAEFVGKAEIMNHFNGRNFSKAATLIERNLSDLEKKTDLPNYSYQRLQLYYLKSLCHYYDEEELALESLNNFYNFLPNLNEEKQKDNLKIFIASLNDFYNETLNFARFYDYFYERKEVYMEIYVLRSKIASMLNCFRCAAQIRRELHSFNLYVIKDPHNKDLLSIYERIDRVYEGIDRIPSIKH